MNGFGPFVTPFVWFKLYWAAWALLLGFAALLFWARGPELGIRQRLATARARFTGGARRLAGLAVVLILTLGGFIFGRPPVIVQNCVFAVLAPLAWAVGYRAYYEKYRVTE